ncbi:MULTISPECIES: iron uptake porin [Nostocales]|uniref:Iron uptake porin n=3 Tax=Nostocales TaxID=1161 RepID=A0A0C1N4H3_9CYAN|nr:iron uptake porin [Tolypothrix bouteillei]KAF3890871.1 iron uptake porin [Tolypothrix bouteillei VB521301]
MTKQLCKLLKVTTVLFVALFCAADRTLAGEIKESVVSVEQLSQESESLSQVTSVSQFSDVQPTDWAFQALQSLVERYGCIAGYPNGTYRGNRALTRYEFAAGLNACLDRVNELIATATADLVKREDLATLQRLQEEFAAELSTLRGRVDAVEARTAELEANQFSTTTKLTGEVIFNVAEAFGDDRAFPYGLDRDDFNGVNLANQTQVVNRIASLTGFNTAQAQALLNSYGAGNFGNLDRDVADNTVFADRVRLNFDASFFGNDRLRVRLQARNITQYSTGTTGTNMTRLGFDGNENNDVELNDLYYQFNLGTGLRVTLAAQTEINDSIYVFNPSFESSGRGSLSRYGRFSPIYRTTDNAAGATLTFGPNSPISASVGFLAPQASDPSLGLGLFNGSYAALGQIAFRPSKAFNVGLTYVRSYFNNEGGVNLLGSTGSFNASRPFGNFATTANNYGLEASFRPSSKLDISGWVGYTNAEAQAGPFEGAEADIFYWAGAIALKDLGKEGNVLGIVFGQPPKVTHSDVIEDPNTSYHLEALYRLRVNDNLSITPGVLVIFNPEHNNDNNTIYIGTIRTTFSF